MRVLIILAAAAVLSGGCASSPVAASTVREMRFYEPAEANTKFGTGHNGGVIAVTLK